MERLRVILYGKLRPPQTVLDLSDGVETCRHSALLADAALDFKRLPVSAQCVLGLVHHPVGNTDGLQDPGFLLLVVKLDGPAEGAVQVIEAARGVVLLDLYPAHGKQSVRIFRLTRDYPRV